MSIFESSSFCGGYDEFAVSKQKYTKEQAIEIAKEEIGCFKKPYYMAVGNGFVRHRAGVNEDGEPRVCWWLEYEERKRSCPVWAFHTSDSTTEHIFNFSKDYEYIEVRDNKKESEATK